MVALITLKMLNMVTGPTENQTYKKKERCQTRVVSNIDSTAPSVSGTDSILWVLISWYDLGMFSRSSWFHTLQPIPRKTCSMSWIQFPFPKSTPFAHSIVLNIKNPFSANFYHPRIVKLPWMHYQHGVHDFSQPVRLITLYSLSEVLDKSQHNQTWDTDIILYSAFITCASSASPLLFEILRISSPLLTPSSANSIASPLDWHPGVCRPLPCAVTWITWLKSKPETFKCLVPGAIKQQQTLHFHSKSLLVASTCIEPTASPIEEPLLHDLLTTASQVSAPHIHLGASDLFFKSTSGRPCFNLKLRLETSLPTHSTAKAQLQPVPREFQFQETQLRKEHQAPIL